MPPRKRTAPPGTAVSYIRVSTDEQAESGLGIEAQRAKIAADLDRHGWRLVDDGEYLDPGMSGGKPVEDRPKLVAALDRIERGDAAALIVAKLDRLSRSAHDAAGLLERAQRNGWHLVACDLGVDTSTPTGEVMANVMGAFARFERRLISQRTSEALQAKRAQGIQLGRRQRADANVVAYIVAKRAEGQSLRAIASLLNMAQVPTSQGGARWYASTVAAVLARPDAQPSSGES